MMVEYYDMKKKVTRTIIYILLAGLMLSGLSGCATWNNFNRAFINKPEVSDTIIKIGVLEPLSGELSKEAADEIAGIELAHELYGSVLNSTVELVYKDDKSDTELAKEAAQELIDEKVSVVIGSYGNMITLRLSYRLDHGRRYRDIQRTMNHTDRETGILSK